MLMGIPLESGKVLSAPATFRVLQEPIYNLPDTISMIVQTKVSLDRLSEFLRLEELKDDVVEKLHAGSADAAVEIENGTFSWDLLVEEPTVGDLNMTIRWGMTVAVCGGVGSGKSSLLSCILGEVHPRSLLPEEGPRGSAVWRPDGYRREKIDNYQTADEDGTTWLPHRSTLSRLPTWTLRIVHVSSGTLFWKKKVQTHIWTL